MWMCSGSELIIGPWGHSGIINNSTQHEHVGTPSRFQIFHHITQFLDQCCSKEAATANGITPQGEVVASSASQASVLAPLFHR